VWTLGRLLDDLGEPFAKAEALFVTLDPERFAPLLEKVASALGVDPEELLTRTLTSRSALPEGKGTR
jgi:hypothetical protein